EVLDVQSRQVERLAGGRHRAQAHQRRVHPGVGVGDQPGPGGQTELGGQVGGGEQGGGGPVGERGGGGGGDPPAGAEGRGQVGHTRDSGAGAGWFVGGGQAPAALRIGYADRDQVGGDVACGEGLGVLALGGLRVRVGTLPGERSEEHTSQLQSRFDLVCRLLLEKKNDKP